MELTVGNALSLYNAVSNIVSTVQSLNASLLTADAAGVLTTTAGPPTYLPNSYAYVLRNPATTDPVSFTAGI